MILRLEPVSQPAIDGALCILDSATLIRRADGAFLEIAAADVARVVRALAFAGTRATPCDPDLSAPAGSIPAVGVDLALLPEKVDVDLVRFRRLGLGEATSEMLRPRFAGLLGPSDAARMRCRAVLHGTDAMLAWSRLAWGSRRTIRRGRASLRPVMFDREATQRSDLRGRTYAAEGAFSWWLFA